MTDIPFQAILQGVRSARYFTLLAPLSAWAGASFAAASRVWWIAIPLAILAAILSLPHALAHIIATRDMWQARNQQPTSRRRKRRGAQE